MDLTTLTDEELEQLRLDVLAEKERRSSLEVIPGQIAVLRRKYIDCGGNPANLPEQAGGNQAGGSAAQTSDKKKT